MEAEKKNITILLQVAKKMSYYKKDLQKEEGDNKARPMGSAIDLR